MADGNGEEPTNGSRVSFTTKELLSRIDTKLDAMDAKLDMKADRARVHELANAINAMEGRVLQNTATLTNRLSLLETSVLRREGPFVEEIRKHEALLTRVVAEQAALTNYKSARFTRTQAILASCFVGLMLALGVVSLLVSLYFGHP